MTSQLAVDAVESAVARRGGNVAGCKLHSDRGGQFRSRKLQQSLWRHQILGSMGQVGSAGDNAAMESFYSLLQRNVLDRQRWSTREELRIAIVTWIERTYHRRRQQARFGRSPDSRPSWNWPRPLTPHCSGELELPPALDLAVVLHLLLSVRCPWTCEGGCTGPLAWATRHPPIA